MPHWVLPDVPPGNPVETAGFSYDAKTPGEKMKAQTKSGFFSMKFQWLFKCTQPKLWNHVFDRLLFVVTNVAYFIKDLNENLLFFTLRHLFLQEQLVEHFPPSELENRAVWDNILFGALSQDTRLRVEADMISLAQNALTDWRNGGYKMVQVDQVVSGEIWEKRVGLQPWVSGERCGSSAPPRLSG